MASDLGFCVTRPQHAQAGISSGCSCSCGLCFSGSCLTFGFRFLGDSCGRGSGRWATVVPVGGRHFRWFHARAAGVGLPLRSGDRGGEEPVVLVELGVVEQRYRAVLEVLDGAVGDRGGPP